MQFPVKESILKRKSVRTFNGNPLSESDKSLINKFIENVPNPFGVTVAFKLLNADEYSVSSPVVLGADHFLAAKVQRMENYEIALGFSFETACLYAVSLGLGTVILGGSLSRAAFEKALDVRENEALPVASPVGYTAKERSIRETLMRKGVKADRRLPFEKLFFDSSFEIDLTKEKAGDFAEALEMVRIAPSAVNMQPWRTVVSGKTVHFYEKKSIKDSSIGDVQKVDMGIAFAHFDLTMQENDHKGLFVFSDPGLSMPANTHYIVSYNLVS